MECAWRSHRFLRLGTRCKSVVHFPLPPKAVALPRALQMLRSGCSVARRGAMECAWRSHRFLRLGTRCKSVVHFPLPPKAVALPRALQMLPLRVQRCEAGGYGVRVAKPPLFEVGYALQVCVHSPLPPKAVALPRALQMLRSGCSVARRGAMECAWRSHRFLRLGTRCKSVCTPPSLPKRWLRHAHSKCSAQGAALRQRGCARVHTGCSVATQGVRTCAPRV